MGFLPGARLRGGVDQLPILCIVAGHLSRRARVGGAIVWALLLGASLGVAQPAQEPSGAATAPTSQPTSAAASQPTTTQAALQEQQEAQVRKELAQEQIEAAKTELETVRQGKEAGAQQGLRGLPPGLVDGQQAMLAVEEALKERQVKLAELRKQYGELKEQVAQRKGALAEEYATIAPQVDTARAGHSAEREALIAEFEQAIERQRAAASELWPRYDQATTELAAFQAEQRELQQRREALDEADPARAKVREALGQYVQLIDNQLLIRYALGDQANEESRLADEYERAADELRAIEPPFWERNAYLLSVGWILLVATGAHVGLSFLTWLVNAMVALVAAGLRRDRATPTIKRVQTLTHFARSIVKLLVWLIAIVTVLAEFGIHPGQSAGALGVIGLVLAGMFQQLVVDFVKGIDIAIGGHYFVGDFIEVGGSSGHVLKFSVKYTVLRTPSGQVITLPNSQCIPSRRFPAGYVDNYVDVPLAGGADLPAARAQLAEVGRLLNARIEAVKREPHIMCTFDDRGQTMIRVQVRVLPTCAWVVKEHYIPMLKERFAAAKIPLAGEPVLFYVNDIPTFRRLFSRQMSGRDIAATLAAESRPTIERAAMPDTATSDGQTPDLPSDE